MDRIDRRCAHRCFSGGQGALGVGLGAMATGASAQAPALVDVAALNGSDTGWLMVCTVLVLLMTLPGVALFYAGMVRRKNVLNTLASVLLVACVVSVLWFAAGYSLAFTPGQGLIGGFSRLGFGGWSPTGWASGSASVTWRRGCLKWRLPCSSCRLPSSPRR